MASTCVTLRHSRPIFTGLIVASMVLAPYIQAQTTRLPSYKVVPAGSTNEPDTFRLSKTFPIQKLVSQRGPNGVRSMVTAETTCWLMPTIRCMGSDTQTRYLNINNFFGTEGSFSFLGQVKSIYNGASSSATVSADLGSFNLANGMQITLATNIQAGSSGVTSVTSGRDPTLSAAAAAQATQNMIYGGTFYASGLLPLIFIGKDEADSRGGLVFSMDLLGREGVDLQNFKAGTSTTVNAPSSHTSLQVESYLQYNSINLNPTAKTYAGALFLGGSYGYNRNSHDYARDYGFRNKVDYDIGQVTAGILLTGVVRVAVSRGFGPSQRYIDSGTVVPAGGTASPIIKNNFKAWSIGINYQSPPPPAPSR